MTWRPTLTVMRKELRDSIRDRRSLGSALLYAVWGPAVMALALMALARSRAPEQPIALVGRENLHLRVGTVRVVRHGAHPGPDPSAGGPGAHRGSVMR